MSTTIDLASVITNIKARKGIYAAYVITLLVVGAITAGFASIGLLLPEWLIATTAVLAFVGIPVNALALANTGNAQVLVSDSEVQIETEEITVVDEAPQVPDIPAADGGTGYTFGDTPRA